MTGIHAGLNHLHAIHTVRVRGHILGKRSYPLVFSPFGIESCERIEFDFPKRWICRRTVIVSCDNMSVVPVQTNWNSIRLWCGQWRKMFATALSLFAGKFFNYCPLKSDDGFVNSNVIQKSIRTSAKQVILRQIDPLFRIWFGRFRKRSPIAGERLRIVHDFRNRFRLNDT